MVSLSAFPLKTWEKVANEEKNCLYLCRSSHDIFVKNWLSTFSQLQFSWKHEHFFFNQNFDLNMFFFNLNSVVCFFKIQIKFLLQILNLIVFLLKDF